MKKLIYLAALLLAGIVVTGCKEVDSGGTTGDSAPAVRVYGLAIPDSYDPETTTGIRVYPNKKTQKYYILLDKKKDKDDFIAANGESAYADKVIKDGNEYTAEGIKDLILEDLYYNYAVTVVPVSGSSKGPAQEATFQGINWSKIGTAVVSTSAAWSAAIGGPIGKTLDVYQDIQDTGAVNHIKLQGVMTNGYDIKMKYDAAGAITSLNGSLLSGAYMVPTGFVHGTHGMVYFRIDPDPDYSGYDIDNNEIVFDQQAAIASGSYFMDWHQMKFELTLD